MSLKGGSANKAGNNYENEWSINLLCNLLLNYPDDTSIYFEKPDEINDGFEFSIYKSTGNEYYQVKKYQKNWTCGSLCKDKIIENFYKKIKQGKNTKCIFLSFSNSSIQELIDRAKRAYDFKTFYSSFLNKELKDDIETLQKEICSIENPAFDYEQINNSENIEIKQNIEISLYNFLNSIEYRVIDVETIKQYNFLLISSLFEFPAAESISDGLFRFSQENYNKKYSKSELIDYLTSEKKYMFKNYAFNDSIRHKIDELVEDFTNANDYFYKNCKIERQEIEQIVKALDCTNGNKFIFVTGNAGSGKSIILKEVAKHCKSNKISILPIDIRNYDNINNIEELGENIFSKKESPVTILQNLSQEKDSIIIIDQLDSLSTVSGRNINKWQIVEKLLYSSMAYTNLKIIIACRSFDLEKDSRLNNFKRINHEQIVEIDTSKLPEKQVKEILLNLDFDEKNINSKTIELFSIPIHLKLLAEIKSDEQSIKLNYQNKMELLEVFWNSKKEFIGATSWNKVIETMVNYLNSRKTLVAPVFIFDEYQADFEKMISAHIFCVVAKDKVSFFHESFFDYCFARIMMRSSETSLENFIIKSDQSLFIRSNVRQTLEFLRINDFKIYLKQLENILNNKDIRIHIKLLILDLLSNFEFLQDEEIEIITNLNSELKEIIYKKYEYYYLIFLSKYKNKELTVDLKSKNDINIEFCHKLICASMPKEEHLILGILEQLSDDEIEKLISYDKDVYRGLTKSKLFFENSRLYTILINAFNKNILDITNYLNMLIYNRNELELDQGTFFDLFIIFIEKEFESRKKEIFIFNISNIGEYIKLIEKNTQLFLDKTFDNFVNIIEKSKAEFQNSKLIYDKLFRWRIANNLDDLLFIYKKAIDKLALQNPSEFLLFFKKYSNLSFETIQFLLLSGLSKLDVQYSDMVLDYIINKPELFDIGYTSDSHYMLKLLINKFSSSCNDKIFTCLLDIILNYKNIWEYEHFKKIKIEGKYKNQSSINITKGQFLASINKERIKKFPIAYKILCELERKFNEGIQFTEPKGIEGGIVTSPLPAKVTEKMTKDQWIKAIYKYNERSFDTSRALELSRSLERIIELNPENFIDFVYLLDKDKTHIYYYDALLSAISKLKNFKEEKEKIAKYCFDIDKKNCSYGLIEIIESIIRDYNELSSDTIEIIIWLATKHPSPQKQLNDDFDFDAINCTRGRAIRLIGDILQKNIKHLDVFESTIELAMNDMMPVKVSCVFVLYGIYNNNKEKALNILEKLISTNNECLKSDYIQEFICKTLFQNNYDFYKDLLSNISTKDNNIKEFISKCFCNYALFYEDAKIIADKFINSNDASYRQAFAKILSAVIFEKDFINDSFVKDNLFKLINDNNEDVARFATSFINKSKKMELILNNEEILNVILNSIYFMNSNNSFLFNLKDYNITINDYKILKYIVLKYIEKIDFNYSNSKNNVRIDISSLFELILKLYDISPEEDSVILDIIDKYLVLPTYTYKENLNLFERTL